jgi:hypothetical protein
LPEVQHEPASPCLAMYQPILPQRFALGFACLLHSLPISPWSVWICLQGPVIRSQCVIAEVALLHIQNNIMPFSWASYRSYNNIAEVTRNDLRSCLSLDISSMLLIRPSLIFCSIKFLSIQYTGKFKTFVRFRAAFFNMFLSIGLFYEYITIRRICCSHSGGYAGYCFGDITLVVRWK